MPQRQRRLRKQAQTLIESVWQLGPLKTEQRRQLADRARALAVEADDLILEAEALLSLSLAYVPMTHPMQVLASLHRAGKIFHANDLRQRSAICRVAAASALCDAGEEAESIRLAQQALQETELSAQGQVHAQLVTALALLYIGDLDAALRHITLASPVAQATAEPALIARVLWAQALTHTFLQIVRHFPDLWFALPSQPLPLAQAMPVPAILALLEATQPAGHDTPWPYTELCRNFVQALFLNDEHAADRLRAMSVRHVDIDPPLSLRALLCLALVRRRDKRDREVLGMLAAGQSMAQRYGLLSLSRSLHLHQAKAHEALGDTQQALGAYKYHAELVVRSLRRRGENGTADTDCDADPEISRDLALPPTPEPQRLRHLEPASVRRAVRFVEDKVLEPLRVSDVVAHCGVSRRTLEIAFKAFKSITVAEFIATRKIERAATMLLHTGLSVKEVATSIGYRSASAFAREFRVRMGASPSEWRRTGSATKDTGP